MSLTASALPSPFSLSAMLSVNQGEWSSWGTNMEKPRCSGNNEYQWVSFFVHFCFPLHAGMCVAEGMKFLFLIGVFELGMG